MSNKTTELNEVRPFNVVPKTNANPPSPKFKPTKRRKELGIITQQQHLFIEAYIELADGKAAAIKAGYSPRTADIKAAQLLSNKEYPHIAREIARLRTIKEEQALKSADDVLRYIHTAMFFEPLRFFKPGERGGWFIDEEGWKNLPPAIGCLIEEVQRRVVVRGSGEHRTEEVIYWIKLVSKSVAMSLAAKHQLGEKVNIVYTHINWNDLYTSVTKANEVIDNDPVEQLIKAKEQLANKNPESNLSPNLKILPTKVTREGD